MDNEGDGPSTSSPLSTEGNASQEVVLSPAPTGEHHDAETLGEVARETLRFAPGHAAPRCPTLPRAGATGRPCAVVGEQPGRSFSPRLQSSLAAVGCEPDARVGHHTEHKFLPWLRSA